MSKTLMIARSLVRHSIGELCVLNHQGDAEGMHRTGGKGHSF
jgi:hypothetical protein